MLNKLVIVLALSKATGHMYLNCRTYFSVRYGTYSTEELVNTAAEHGIHVLALTNINCTCDSWDFVNFCQQKEIKPVLGVEIRNEDELLYIIIARNNQGFARINEFLSSHLQKRKTFLHMPLAILTTALMCTLFIPLIERLPLICYLVSL